MLSKLGLVLSLSLLILCATHSVEVAVSGDQSVAMAAPNGGGGSGGGGTCQTSSKLITGDCYCKSASSGYYFCDVLENSRGPSPCLMAFSCPANNIGGGGFAP